MVKEDFVKMREDLVRERKLYLEFFSKTVGFIQI